MKHHEKLWKARKTKEIEDELQKSWKTYEKLLKATTSNESFITSHIKLRKPLK
jgi:hypothetical protein